MLNQKCRDFFSEAALYFSAFFVTVATILGTGILGLPVKLANAGFFPFLVTFALCLVMQFSIVWLMVDLLQRTHVQLLRQCVEQSILNNESDTINPCATKESRPKSLLSIGAPSARQHAYDTPHPVSAAVEEGLDGITGAANLSDETSVEEAPPLSEFQSEQSHDQFNVPLCESSIVDTSVSPHHPTSTQTTMFHEESALLNSEDQLESLAIKYREEARPDLHAMGKMLLGVSGRRMFDSAVLLHFISVLISYALAGSLAYGQLIGIEFTYLIAPYVAIYTLIIVFGAHFIQPIISAFTVAKCTLLLFMIGVVGYVANTISIHPSNHWNSTMEPFLLGTVALGGVVNIMPVIYTRIPFNKRSIGRFKWSVVLGVTVCWILNVVWAYFVLNIVPQTEAEARRDKEKLHGVIVSLEGAEDRGEISTVPVIDVINAGYQQYHWVAITVTAFIVLSVSVSYLTLGTGLKHVLDGIVRHRWRHRQFQSKQMAVSHQSNHLGGSIAQTENQESYAMTLEENDVSNWTLPISTITDSHTAVFSKETTTITSHPTTDTTTTIPSCVESIIKDDTNPHHYQQHHKHHKHQHHKQQMEKKGQDQGVQQEQEEEDDLEQAHHHNAIHQQENDDLNDSHAQQLLASHSETEYNMCQYKDPDGNEAFKRCGIILLNLCRIGISCICFPCNRIVHRFGNCFKTQISEKIGLYCVMFGFILAISLVNPQGFLLVLEVFTSLALNLEAGVFIGLMWLTARKKEKELNETVPSITPNGAISNSKEATNNSVWCHTPSNLTSQRTNTLLLSLQPPALLSDTFGKACMWFAVVSFSFACIFDIVDTLAGLIGIELALYCFFGATLLIWRVFVRYRISSLCTMALFYYTLPVPLQMPHDFGHGVDSVDAVVLYDHAQKTPTYRFSNKGIPHGRRKSVVWRLFAARWLRDHFWPVFHGIIGIASICCIASIPSTNMNLNANKIILRFAIGFIWVSFIMEEITYVLQMHRSSYRVSHTFSTKDNTETKMTDHSTSFIHSSNQSVIQSFNENRFKKALWLRFFGMICGLCACGFIVASSDRAHPLLIAACTLMVLISITRIFVWIAHSAQKSIAQVATYANRTLNMNHE